MEAQGVIYATSERQLLLTFLPVPEGHFLLASVFGLSLRKRPLDLRLKGPKFREKRGGSPEPESKKWIPQDHMEIRTDVL